MSRHRHLTRQLLLAARRGTLPSRAFAELLLSRLIEACPHCRQIVETVEEQEIPLPDYRAPVARALRRIPVAPAIERYEEQARLAPELLAQLEPLSPAQRLLMVRNSPGRFSNLALGERVLDASRACLPHDPAGSLGWAEVADAIAASYLSDYYPHRARALALQGNAHRALGDFTRARQLLDQAREMLNAHHVFDLDIGAELNSFLGSLHTELGEWDEASHHLESALALYQVLGDAQNLARIFINLGNLHHLLGDPAAAADAHRAACQNLDPETETRLYLAARLNYAFDLQELGESTRARDVLDHELELYDTSTDPLLITRVSWLRARLAVEFGHPEEAERRYLELRDQFAAREHGFHAALVSVELASLYLQQGRFSELEETARQAVQLFQAHAVHQRALAALLLLYDAARARTLTLDALERTAGFLRRAEHDPQGRFRTAH